MLLRLRRRLLLVLRHCLCVYFMLQRVGFIIIWKGIKISITFFLIGRLFCYLFILFLSLMLCSFFSFSVFFLRSLWSIKLNFKCHQYCRLLFQINASSFSSHSFIFNDLKWTQLWRKKSNVLTTANAVEWIFILRFGLLISSLVMKIKKNSSKLFRSCVRTHVLVRARVFLCMYAIQMLGWSTLCAALLLRFVLCCSGTFHLTWFYLFHRITFCSCSHCAASIIFHIQKRMHMQTIPIAGWIQC